MFCKGFGNNFKKFLLKVDRELAAKAQLALSITTKLRGFLNGDAVSLAILIAGKEVDDKIFEKLLHALDVAIGNLSITATCSMQPSLAVKLECFVNEVKKLHPDLQNSLLVKIASIITAHLDDHWQQQNVYDALVQGTYTLNKQ